jgi:hypothetical protein
MFTEGESIYVCRGFGASPNQHRRAFSGNSVAVCWLLSDAKSCQFFRKEMARAFAFLPSS